MQETGLKTLRYLPPAEAMLRKEAFARILDNTPPSEQMPWDEWVEAVRGGGVVVLGNKDLIVALQFGEDTHGDRFLHISGISGKGMLRPGWLEDVETVARALGVKYLLAQTNPRLGRIIRRRYKANLLAELSRKDISYVEQA